MGNFCRHCGAKLIEGNNFCNNCGSPVAKPAPVVPVAEPVAPYVEPVASVAEPVAPYVEPVAPVAEPIAPVAEPVAPYVEPVAPVAEPVAPYVEPVVPVAEPVAPYVEPVAPVAEPVAPYVESVAPVAESVAPYVEPVASVAVAPAPMYNPYRPVTIPPQKSLLERIFRNDAKSIHKKSSVGSKLLSILLCFIMAILLLVTVLVSAVRNVVSEDGLYEILENVDIVQLIGEDDIDIICENVLIDMQEQGNITWKSPDVDAEGLKRFLSNSDGIKEFFAEHSAALAMDVINDSNEFELDEDAFVDLFMDNDVHRDIEKYLGEEVVVMERDAREMAKSIVGSYEVDKDMVEEQMDGSLDIIRIVFADWLFVLLIVLNLLFVAALISCFKGTLRGIRCAGWVCLIIGILYLLVCLAGVILPDLLGGMFDAETEAIMQEVLPTMTSFVLVPALLLFVVGLAGIVVVTALRQALKKKVPVVD